MQILVKTLDLESKLDTQWYRNIEGRLIEDPSFLVDFDESCALNYHCQNNEGYLYLYSINSPTSAKNMEYKIYIKFLETEVCLAQEIVQKYLMYRSMFWNSVDEAFNYNVEESETITSTCPFSFDFNKILNSPIRLPETVINKEYSLPIIIPIEDTNTLALLAAGINGFKDIYIMTLDTIEDDVDFHKTVFITNKPNELKVELKNKLKTKKIKSTITLSSKVIASIVSIAGVFLVGFTFFKNHLYNKNK